MWTFLAVALLAVKFLVVPSPVAKYASVRVEFGGIAGHECSGTIIGPNAVLTAMHCLEHGGPVSKVERVPVEQIELLDDGADHAIVLFRGTTFKVWPKVRLTPPREGEIVYTYGSPTEFYRLLRFGTYSLVHSTAIMGQERQFYVFTYGGAGGDSGAGIFDADGQLLAVHSIGYQVERLILSGAYPLKFSKADFKRAREFRVLN